jgi:cytosine/adenosine deaminase-related metal-dependent hydrolase
VSSRVYSADWVVPVEGEPIERGAVAVAEDGSIAAVGAAADLGEGERLADAVIVPGFVNAHSHLEYAVYAGFGDGLTFAPWLAVHIERKQRLHEGDALAIARLGAAESLRSGVTCVGDASFSGASAGACAELGLRAIVYLEVFGSDTRQLEERFATNRDRHAGAWSDLVRLGVSPHAPYTVGLELYRACAGLGLPLATHVAESEAEQEWLTRGTGPWAELAHMLPLPLGETGVRALARAGLLGPGMVAAHCVHVDDEEIALLADNDVAVAHCPRSNALLGCGIAPLRQLLDAGIRVGLGTDSPASTPSFDLFDELRAAVFAARVAVRDPLALSPREALELATLGSARALGLDSEVGSLVPGKRADLTVVSLKGSPFLPWEDPVGAVVFGGSSERILLTVVDGTERYRKGRTEWHELTDAATAARRRMLSPPGAATPA